MYLGIDPGIRKLGYGLIDTDQQIVDAGVLLLDQRAPTRIDQFARMHEIYEFFVAMIDQYPIEAVGIEKLFFTKYNQSNAEFVYGIRGALGMLFRRHTIPIYEWTPIQLKKNITGNGKAGKEAMQKMIMKLFQLDQQPKRHDTADALGLARLAKRKNAAKG
jgi:crossover junction endodeoxyribonuclease RuvC